MATEIAETVCVIKNLHLLADNFYESFVSQIKNSSTFDYSYRLVLSLKDDDQENPKKNIGKIKFGISSRNRKIYSKPMIEILYRLCACIFLDIIIIPDHVVRNFSVDKWPIVDVFLCFYANGYPLDKAIDYVRLRRPFVINELSNQKLLFNRKEIYRILTENNVCVPKYIVVERYINTLQPTEGEEVIEDGDTIIYNGQKLSKPFVEKPFDAENHNITIYFPNSIGGGCQKLFRKMGNRSSFYCRDGGIRRNTSYIYEEFLLTEGADVKVYCVGPEYAHAEARKSPALDGKVERDYTGKEMRYPVILASAEKYIARKVVEIFHQNVCGLDMLKTGGKCYVCDVNGFSFVKKSTKYYDDCAQMIAEIILCNCCHNLSFLIENPLKSSSTDKLKIEKNSKNNNTLELVSVIAIIRHGDRTPKQKMKLLTRHPEFFKLFEKYGGNNEARVKLKKPSELQDVLDVTNFLLQTNTTKRSYEAIDNPAKLLQMKYVLEMYGQFMGFNRKVQIKSLDDKRNKILEYKFRAHHPQDCVEINFSEPSLLLILKWGGELTEVGRMETEEFGQHFSKLYPNSKISIGPRKFLKDSKFSKGLLRLHSTYRHNMKVFASDEGRVQLTAAAFARGMLSLESQLAPILVHLVVCDKKTTQMLDSSNQVEFKLLEVKKNLHDKLSVNRFIDEDYINELSAPNQTYLKEQLREIINPYEACRYIHRLIILVHEEIKRIFNIKRFSRYLSPDSTLSNHTVKLCHGETYDLMERRWGKLAKDFKMKNNNYDISLIPDIYDCARYDYFHNSKLNINHLADLYENSKRIAQVIITQEYGTTAKEKLSISKDVCNKLLKKISSDLKHNFNFYDDEGHILNAGIESSVSTPHRRVRTRLYFTSESHIHGLMNVFRYGSLFENISNDPEQISQYDKALQRIDNLAELDFLSHILIMQYEDCLLDENNPERFKVEIFFSPEDQQCNRSSYLSSENPPFNTESLTEALNQLRKPHVQASKFNVKNFYVTDYLYDLNAIGPFLPRKKLVDFLDSISSGASICSTD
ncbi:hypothetical protein HZS_7491 [Henneguya salminicola]|nr:hypothetical protein HZS_7491 [Henneguya salminicola]